VADQQQQIAEQQEHIAEQQEHIADQQQQIADLERQLATFRRKIPFLIACLSPTNGLLRNVTCGFMELGNGSEDCQADGGRES
jgi:septal ring factor EnvC (AmiA/AmiB activator)